MRKLLLLLAAFAMLAVTGAAAAATTTVTITKAGYVPSAPKIAQGDSVQFVNSDTVAHEIDFKPTTGVTCTPNPLVLQPGQSGTCTFQTAGSTTYSDPNAKGNTFRGTITVSAAGQESLTLVASLQRVVYGGHVNLSGMLSSHKVGENVDVFALGCGTAAPVKVMTVQTTANGAYAAVVQPLLNTSYTVKVKNTTSAAVGVMVRPRFHLGKVAAHRFSHRVSASTTFAGKYSSFQRYNGSRWVALKSVLLRSNTMGVSPTVLTTASFKSAIKVGVRVRGVVGQAQVGNCYLPAFSNTIRS